MPLRYTVEQRRVCETIPGMSPHRRSAVGAIDVDAPDFCYNPRRSYRGSDSSYFSLAGHRLGGVHMQFRNHPWHANLHLRSEEVDDDDDEEEEEDDELVDEDVETEADPAADEDDDDDFDDDFDDDDFDDDDLEEDEDLVDDDLDDEDEDEPEANEEEV
jgi:hypothetical protein